MVAVFIMNPPSGSHISATASAGARTGFEKAFARLVPNQPSTCDRPKC
jgi:hypothetical protein